MSDEDEYEYFEFTTDSDSSADYVVQESEVPERNDNGRNLNDHRQTTESRRQQQRANRRNSEIQWIKNFLQFDIKVNNQINSQYADIYILAIFLRERYVNRLTHNLYTDFILQIQGTLQEWLSIYEKRQHVFHHDEETLIANHYYDLMVQIVNRQIRRNDQNAEQRAVVRRIYTLIQHYLEEQQQLQQRREEQLILQKQHSQKLNNGQNDESVPVVQKQQQEQIAPAFTPISTPDKEQVHEQKEVIPEDVEDKQQMEFTCPKVHSMDLQRVNFPNTSYNYYQAEEESEPALQKTLDSIASNEEDEEQTGSTLLSESVKEQQVQRPLQSSSFLDSDDERSAPESPPQQEQTQAHNQFASIPKIQLLIDVYLAIFELQSDEITNINQEIIQRSEEEVCFVFQSNNTPQSA